MPVITDEQIDRAFSKFSPSWHSPNVIDENRKRVREILEAAFNPKSVEPEIHLTTAMEQAGRGALNKYTWIDTDAGAYVKCNDYTAAICDAYRAMRKLEPKTGGTYVPDRRKGERRSFSAGFTSTVKRACGCVTVGTRSLGVNRRTPTRPKAREAHSHSHTRSTDFESSHGAFHIHKRVGDVDNG